MWQLLITANLKKIMSNSTLNSGEKIQTDVTILAHYISYIHQPNLKTWYITKILIYTEM